VSNRLRNFGVKTVFVIRNEMQDLRFHADDAVCWEREIGDAPDGRVVTQNLLDCVPGQTWQLEIFRFRSHDLEASALLNNISSLTSPRKEIAILWDGENISLPNDDVKRVRICRRLRATIQAMYPGSIISESRIYDDSTKSSSIGKESAWAFLSQYGYTVVNCVNASAESVDKVMIIDALTFTWRCLESHTRPIIFLISRGTLFFFSKSKSSLL